MKALHKRVKKLLEFLDNNDVVPVYSHFEEQDEQDEQEVIKVDISKKFEFENLINLIKKVM